MTISFSFANSLNFSFFNVDIVDIVDILTTGQNAKNKPSKEVIFDVDLFVPTKNGRKCGVMLPGSLAINKRNNYGYHDIISYPNERTKIEFHIQLYLKNRIIELLQN